MHDPFYDPTHRGEAGTVITDHEVLGAFSGLKITVVDNPGPGNGNHRYDITGFNTENNPSNTDADGYRASFSREIVLFQQGTILETGGPNGITIESLLAICAHRLQGFQNGPFASANNDTAFHHIKSALRELKKRTEERLRRGVEGTHQK